MKKYEKEKPKFKIEFAVSGSGRKFLFPKNLPAVELAQKVNGFFGGVILID